MVKIVTMYKKKYKWMIMNEMYKQIYIDMVVCLLVGLYEGMGIHGFVFVNSVLSGKPTDFL